MRDREAVRNCDPLTRLEAACAEYHRVLSSVRIIGYMGASTTTAYVSDADYYRLGNAGRLMNEAYTEAMKAAFA